MNQAVKTQSPIAKIAQHYQSAISGELTKINIPEWDMEIYCRKTYPFKEESKIIELQSQGKTVDALVESLIVKALDKEGKKIFTAYDRVSLMSEADPSVIVRVVGEINNLEQRAKIEDLVKE
jgi:hypothetical protein